MLLRLGVRNVFRHRTRSAITLGTIAFGCTAVIFVGGFFEDIFFKMRESYITAHTGHLQITRRGFHERGRAEPFRYLIERSEEATALVHSVEGVATVARRLPFGGLISSGDNTIACLAQGVEPAREPAVRLADVASRREDLALLGGSVVESGEPLDPEDPYGAILGRGLAAGIDAQVGDGLILVAHTVGGSINALDVTVRGIFFTSAKEFDDYALRLPLATAQQLLYTDMVQSLVVTLHETRDTPRVRATLERLFQDRQLDFELKTWDELSDFYVKTQALFARMFFILQLVVAIIVILSISNTMAMAVLERTAEIGTIMALGTTRHGVQQLFLAEGLALGVLGGGLGLLVGVAVTLGIRSLGIPMPPPPGATMAWVSEPIVVPSVLASAFGLSVATALLSAWYPARTASRLEIAEALRHAS